MSEVISMNCPPSIFKLGSSGLLSFCTMLLNDFATAYDAYPRLSR